MGGDPREVKKVLTEELFRRARLAWERHQAARAKDDMPGMRQAYDEMVQMLLPVYQNGSKDEVIDFLRKTEGAPVRAILKRLNA